MAQPLDPDILRHYEVAGERSRLTANAAGRLEFERTRELLGRWLPEPPARILDVGGGPGAHAVWLAADGHEVELLDPVALHVEQARAAAAAAPRGFSAPPPGGLRAELAHAGLAVEAVLAVEGPAWLLQDLDRRWNDGTECDRLLEAIRLVEAEDSLLGASADLLAAARRPGGRPDGCADA